MGDREMWSMIRRALIMILHAIDKRWGFKTPEDLSRPVFASGED